MSAVAPSQTPWRQYGRILRRCSSTRGLEVCTLQASPLLGVYLADPGVHDVGRATLMMLGSTALTAHIFLFNDWADYSRDTRDVRRARAGVNGYGLRRDQIGHVTIALLVLAAVAFAALGTSAVLFGAGIAALSLLYSFSPYLGKGTPVAASLNHLVGGALHFMLGYVIGRGVDARGLALSLVFGMVFAAGHLNQEIRDYESDRANGIRTVAVAFGRRRGFLASFGLFTIAYLLIVVLAAGGVLPTILLLSAAAWLAQARWSLQALRLGLSAETALWTQRRYRLLFALVGLAMLVR
jgi:4-hydroxybenzoate polyprenyltransferase